MDLFFQSNSPQIQRKTHKPKLLNLVRVSRDVEYADVMAMEFLVKGEEVRMVMTDRWGNMVVSGYDSLAPETFGGRVLQRQSEFYVDRQIVSTMRLQCVSPMSASGQKPVPSKWHFVKYHTLQGSQGYVVPVAEVSYRRLEMLQGRLHIAVPHLAGLNPRQERYGELGGEGVDRDRAKTRQSRCLLC